MPTMARTAGTSVSAATSTGERFVVEVADEGAGIGLAHGYPAIGHGLAMVGALA